MLFYLIYISTGILVVLGLYVILETKRLYDRGKALTIRVSLGYWILDTIKFILVVLSSLYTIWPMHFNRMWALIWGSILLGGGVVTMLAGMIEFRSIKRISGLNNSLLVTTGVYQWSRNPQYIGWFLMLFGISLIGRSGLALLYTILGIILFHLYVTRIEEPYLELVFREEYLSYKLRTPRYIGIPKRRADRSAMT